MLLIEHTVLTSGDGRWSALTDYGRVLWRTWRFLQTKDLMDLMKSREERKPAIVVMTLDWTAHQWEVEGLDFPITIYRKQSQSISYYDAS